MNQRYFIYDSKRFLRDWFVMGVIVWPAALFAGGIVAAVLGFIMLTFFRHFIDFYSYNTSPFDFGVFVVATCVGATIGLVTGYLQRHVMRQWFGWEHRKWLWVNLLGGALGGGLLILLDFLSYRQNTYGYTVLYSLPMEIWMPIFVACLSSMQSLVLRKRINGVWLWILANVVGGLVWGGVLTSNPRGEVLVLWAIGTIAQAGITGWALLWLFHSTPVSVWEEAV